MIHQEPSNPLLVCVHGFAGTPELWVPVLEALPPGWSMWSTCVAGHSERAPRATSWSDEVERLANAVLEVSGDRVQDIHLLGYSLGARLCLSAASWLEARGQRLGRLVLVGGTAGLETPEARRERATADARLAQQLRTSPEAFFEAWEALPLFASQWRHPELQEKQRAWRKGLDPERLAEALERLGLAQMPNHWPMLAHLTCPVLLVVGEEDEKFRALAERMAQRLPRCWPVLVPGCGHNVVLERPQALARALLEARDG